MFLKIEIDLSEERPEDERWALAIKTSDEGFPAYLSTHRFVEDALEQAKSWVASTSYI